MEMQISLHSLVGGEGSPHLLNYNQQSKSSGIAVPSLLQFSFCPGIFRAMSENALELLTIKNSRLKRITKKLHMGRWNSTSCDHEEQLGNHKLVFFLGIRCQ